jgi:hypothetical protein
MLAIAGFEAIDVLSDHSHDPASSESEILVYVATR